MLGQVLDGDTVGQEAAAGAHILVLGAVPLGEAPLLGDVNLQDKNDTDELNVFVAGVLNKGY